ncbi:glutamate racemase [Candidatus Ferrigenium straubiae]|jgi:glutamate racemase|uniref:glutamate racemase n=1 Tax=Candidatus Ferrigenium straubiae TaxID=2919506 RepID=UPI003F4AD9C0
MAVTDPIGVFDSGVGGLSVLREIRCELPHEDLLYVADSGHAPYGDKPAPLIEARSIAIVEFLVSRRAKAIVVACNTATGAAVAALRARFSLPIVAMEPAVKPAAASTRSGVIGVLATGRTLASENFERLHARFGADVDILVQACPGLVEQVEAGDFSGARTRALLEQYVLPLLERQADTLVLGCTHYPFLAPLIRKIAGPSVAIVDPSAAIARELRRRLTDAGLLSHEARAGTERFWSSATPDKAQRVISQLWRTGIEVQSLPEKYPGRMEE